ncbi:MAG: tetratricopeptide repeat protein [Deltaproteobacteria bacterium]
MNFKLLHLSLAVGLLLLVAPPNIYSADNGKIGEQFEESFVSEAAGNYDAALNSVLRVLRIDQKHYTAMLRAGWLTYLKGDFSAAEKYYRKAVSLAPDAIEPMQGLLLPLVATKKWLETESTARKILKTDQKNYTAYSKLAYVLFQQGKYGDARIIYRNLLDWYPSDTEMKLGLAWTYQRMGRTGEAARYFKEVLDVYQSNQSALAGMETLRQVSNR